MRPSSVVQTIVLALVVAGCTSAEDAPPSPAFQPDPQGQVNAPPVESAVPGEPEQSATSEAQTAPRDGALLLDPPQESPAFGGHVTTTEIVAPAASPTGELDGVLRFEAFGPAPGTSPEQFAEWTQLMRERFLDTPTPEQLVELDARLEEVPVIDATPVCINALLGLDMADPEDIVRAGAITEWWYLNQIRYKQVILDGDPEALRPINVRNRMLVVDGWIRMWKRTLQSEGGVDRLRARVEQLIADRQAAREKQQREYEEKVRQREKEAAENPR